MNGTNVGFGQSGRNFYQLDCTLIILQLGVVIGLALRKLLAHSVGPATSLMPTTSGSVARTSCVEFLFLACAYDCPSSLCLGLARLDCSITNTGQLINPISTQTPQCRYRMHTSRVPQFSHFFESSIFVRINRIGYGTEHCIHCRQPSYPQQKPAHGQRELP